jgi:rubrerythrin
MRQVQAEQTDAAIEAFLLAFFQSQGAHVHGGSICLPRTLARDLGVKERLELRFSSQPAGRAEYITHGHPLLDSILTMTMKRGTTASLLACRPLGPEFFHHVFQSNPFTDRESGNEEYDRLRGVLQGISFPDGPPRLIDRSFSFQLQLLFGFRASFISDERREQLITIVVDPVTEAADTPVELDKTVSFIPVKGIERPQAYTTLRLYGKARQALEAELAPSFTAFSEESRARFEEDSRRIGTYYAGLAQEALDPLRKVFRQMASSSVRMQLTHCEEAGTRYSKQLQLMKLRAHGIEQEYERELKALREEKERRLSELAARYKTRVEARLISLAALRVPRVTLVMRVSKPTRRDIDIIYDVLRGRLVGYMCESCGHPLSESYVCPCGDLLCKDCLALCR